MRNVLNVFVVVVVSLCLWNLHITDTYLMQEIDRFEYVPILKELSSQDIIASAMQSVVHIRAGDPNDIYNSWEGSGVYVGNNLIMTAKHVIGNVTQFIVTFENGEEYISGFALSEGEADIGFIYICKVDQSTLKFNTDILKRGDVVYVLGNPFGLKFKFSVTKGIVSAVNREHENFYGNKLIFQVDAAGYPGDSGSPVVNELGEIVGVMVGGFSGGDNIGLCIPVNICKKALDICLEVLEMKEMI